MKFEIFSFSSLLLYIFSFDFCFWLRARPGQGPPPWPSGPFAPPRHHGAGAGARQRPAGHRAKGGDASASQRNRMSSEFVALHLTCCLLLWRSAGPINWPTVTASRNRDAGHSHPVPRVLRRPAHLWAGHLPHEAEHPLALTPGRCSGSIQPASCLAACRQ